MAALWILAHARPLPDPAPAPRLGVALAVGLVAYAVLQLLARWLAKP